MAGMAKRYNVAKAMWTVRDESEVKAEVYIEGRR
jgi:hypothetical protein